MHAISCVAIADWRVKDVVAFLDPRLHLLDHLTAVLFTLQLALRGEDRFNEFAFGRVIQLEVQTFDPRAARLKLAPQLDMEFRIAGKALQIIEDDNVILVGLRIEIAQQRNLSYPFVCRRIWCRISQRKL
ncbi:MAG: hypothetical protein RQ750_14720 [Roseovarius sp.]|nr:hypothetical protein [Roseovarius sp.]